MSKYSDALGNPETPVVIVDPTGTYAMVVNPASQLLVNTEGQKATYTTAAVNVALTVAGDFFQLVPGVGKVIRVTRIGVSATATAAVSTILSVARRSSADSAGTPTAQAIYKHDSTDAASTATATNFSGGTAPNAGALAGLLRETWLGVNTTASGVATPVVLDFTTRNAKALVFRGNSDYLVLNVGAIGAGAAISFDVEFTEE